MEMYGTSASCPTPDSNRLLRDAGGHLASNNSGATLSMRIFAAAGRTRIQRSASMPPRPPEWRTGSRYPRLVLQGGIWRGFAARSRRPLRSENALRVPGFVRQHAGIDPDLAQGALVFFLDVAAEDQIRVGVAVQPAIVLDFGLQLSGRPAGIAEREDGMLRAGAPGDRLENIDGRREANAVIDAQSRILDKEIA